MSDHSIIAPSSAHVWGAFNGCTGSALMEAQYPEDDTNEASIVGTAVHELCANLLNAISRNGNGPEILVKQFVKSSSGIVYTEEMIDAALAYVVDIYEVMQKLHMYGGPNFNVENKISCLKIHPYSYGTPDFWLYDGVERKIHLWDFKYGHGLVEAFENWQGINYVSGILDLISPYPFENGIKVNITVVQPRGYHTEGIIRTWETDVLTLKPFFEQLKKAAHEALGPDASLRTGSHCRYCKARHACPSFSAKTLASLEFVGAPLAHDLSTDALGLELSLLQDAADTIKYRLTGLQSEMKARIKKGERATTYILEPGVGNLEWTQPVGEVIRMGQLLGCDLAKKAVLTPTQAMAKGVSKDVVMSLAKRKQTGLKLVKNTNIKARKIFGRK